jgi:hypothetical protein
VIIASQTTIALPVATQRVAAELSSLSDRLQRLEDGLEIVFTHSGHALDGETIGMLQEVDVVLQSVQALSQYLVQISDATMADGTVYVEPALERVPLRDVARRLGGCVEVRDTTGHAELF